VKLAHHRALENALAEDPFDESRWIVLEDWLLERDDPRAELVILEKQGANTGPVLRKLASALLGDHHESLNETLYQRDWRAGFLRECQYTGGTDALRSFLHAPASSLLRAFTLTTHPGEVERTVGAFIQRRCVRSLQRLTLSSWNHDGSDRRIPCAGLQGMVQLRHLILRTVMVQVAPVLPKLHALTLAPMRTSVVALTDQLGQIPWPSITDLTYEAPDMHGAGVGLRSLLALVDEATFPSLQRLDVSGLAPAEHELALPRLAEACGERGVVLTTR
jgi:uncharacterized protein (TIGR02996 family)